MASSHLTHENKSAFNGVHMVHHTQVPKSVYPFFMFTASESLYYYNYEVQLINNATAMDTHTESLNLRTFYI